jgi:rhodanese-related sulfurtransferase
MAERLGSWGVGSHSQVIVYDTSGGAYAARLWWQLRFLGHTNVAVLDGGFQKWQKEGRPVAQGQESHSPAVFTPAPQWQMIADVHTVDRIRADPEFLLIDARTPERYRGEREPIDPVAGHIPGAVNRFHGENLDMQGHVPFFQHTPRAICSIIRRYFPRKRGRILRLRCYFLPPPVGDGDRWPSRRPIVPRFVERMDTRSETAEKTIIMALKGVPNPDKG